MTRKINKIVGIKIIKAEAQVNLAWSPFIMKDKIGNLLYSMIRLVPVPLTQQSES